MYRKDSLNILVIMLHWYPYEGPLMPIYKPVFQDLIKRGNEVTIVTSFPHYRKGRMEKWDEYRGKLFERSELEGIKIIRSYVFAPVFKNDTFSIFFRALNFITFNISSLLSAILLGGKADVIFAPSSPPLTNGLIAFFASFFKNCPTVYNVQDLYPDIAINTKIIKNRLILQLLRKLEMVVYKLSNNVLTISKSMAELIANKGVERNKIAIIRNSIDTEFIKPSHKTNLFSKKYKINNSFVIMYAGNIGIPHGVEVLIRTAKLFKSEKDIIFCFVARGENKSLIEKLSQKEELKNVKFVPPQPEEIVNDIWASASVGVITYKKNLADFCLPSKLLAMMCAARPVIASLDNNSEVAKTVVKSKCGVVVPPEDERAIAEAIKIFKKDPNLTKRMGFNGREYVEKNHQREIISNEYYNYFEYLAKSKL